jgi:hypothetical protein
MRPSADPKPGMGRSATLTQGRGRRPRIGSVRRLRLIDLIENATVGEVLRLCLGPAAEQRIVEQAQKRARELERLDAMS